jgi:glyoxylase-like metal-dependent hydrolase (beta-lactamase superfamily II)
VLEGSGGKVAVLAGRDGKVPVDAGIAVSRPQLAAALSGLGPEPVTHLINTHWHFDHANGDEWLHELGPEILAHENTRQHLSTMQRVDDWDFDFSTGGSNDGSIRAADANLAATTDTTIIIPGHGPPVSNRSELQDFRDMLVGIREDVAALKRQGRSAGRSRIPSRPSPPPPTMPSGATS